MHRIEVYEPYDYDGPNPLLVVGSGLVTSPDKKPAYLLSVDKPLTLDGVTCEQLIVRPRHADPIERATESVCTVLIFLVRPESRVEVGDSYQFTDTINWGIGKIHVQKA